MNKSIRVLVVEDRAVDAELIIRELRRAGFEPDWQRVDTEAAFIDHLQADLDLVLSDFEMPQFSGLRALELRNQSGRDVPFILISGTMGEDTAVAAMKQGAEDYLLKDRLARLGPAVTQALDQRRLRRERQHAERALLEANAHLHHLVSRSPTVIYSLDLTDRSGRMNYVSPNISELTGLTVEQTVGTDWWREHVHPDDRGTALARLQLAKADESSRVEYRLRHVSGHYVWVEDRVRLLPAANGQPAGMVGGWTDITARKKAEAALRESETQFRQVVENIREVFWMTDPNTNRMLYVSPAYQTVWGRTCESLYADPRTWLESIHPEDRDRAAQAATTKQIRGDYDETYRITRPDGTVRWIRDRAVPLRGPAGEVHRIVGTAEDVTEYRTLEEQFRQAQKMEAIGTLAGGIAHDFNNILTAIGGYTELARMMLTDNPVVHAYLTSVLQASSRATHLVRQILTFSRQQPQQRRAINLLPAVAETVQLLRATIPTTIEFELSLAADAPTVLADTTQIHQVLMNLGTNAWHAMKDRTGRLQVKLERCVVDEAYAATHPKLRPGVYAHISVSDTGSGMDAVTLRRIFEPFFTTKPSGEGTGLGLSVVHGIMDSHDGAITVYSQPGEGTVFHLYFPEHAGGVAADKSDDKKTPLGQGERVLFVDDEELLAKLGQKTLTALGYQVEITTSPAAALAMVRSDPEGFAVVLTDETMPGLTGMQLARQLLQIRPGLPIILMTGYSASLTAESVKAAGLRQLLPKPTTIHSLASAMRAALSPPALR